MRQELLNLLVDPVDGSLLTLDNPRHASDGDIVSGTLLGRARSYSVSEGVPRFVFTDDQKQRQTQTSFGYKWRQKSTYDSAASLDQMRRWLVEKYGFGTERNMRAFFADRHRILDAGSGAAFSSSTWLDDQWIRMRADRAVEFVAVDISDAIDVALDECARYHFYATYRPKVLGGGTVHLVGPNDKDGELMNGTSTFRLHFPCRRGNESRRLEIQLHALSPGRRPEGASACLRVRCG